MRERKQEPGLDTSFCCSPDAQAYLNSNAITLIKISKQRFSLLDQFNYLLMCFRLIDCKGRSIVIGKNDH